MLSPGTYHLVVPKDLIENVDFRTAILRRCAEDHAARAAVLWACKQDILFFLNVFCWTFRPKAAGHERKLIPFVTWDCQDTAVRFVVDHVDRQIPFVAEKSRDMGWSWVCCYVADWLWRFQEWTKTGLFSRIGDLVDSKTPDSLFWKVRFIQTWLPKWMYPEGWNPRLHDTSMYRENPETHSVITGQATTQDMGIAGRCTFAVFDEFSRVPNAQTVLDNTKDTSDCRAFVSTHTGPDTAFAHLCKNGVTDKIVTHWSEHPGKAIGLYRYDSESNALVVLDTSYQFPVDYQFVKDGTPTGGPYPGLRSPWYDRQCRERSSVDVKTNLDIDLFGSTSQFFDTLRIRQLQATVCCDPYWEGDLIYDSSLATPIRLHKRPGGLVKLWCHLRDDLPPASRHGAGADIATGTGATPSTLSITNGRGEKVLEYANAHIRAREFAEFAVATCRLFVDENGEGAKFCWEHSGAGAAFTERVIELGYGNVYQRAPEFEMVTPSRTGKVGWVPTPQAKRTLLERYRDAVETGKMVNRSRRALEETLSYEQLPNTSVEHMGTARPEDPAQARENHGDLVMSDAQSWKMVDESGIVPEEEAAAEGPPLLSLAWRREYRSQQREYA